MYAGWEAAAAGWARVLSIMPTEILVREFTQQFASLAPPATFQDSLTGREWVMDAADASDLARIVLGQLAAGMAYQARVGSARKVFREQRAMERYSRGMLVSTPWSKQKSLQHAAAGLRRLQTFAGDTPSYVAAARAQLQLSNPHLSVEAIDDMLRHLLSEAEKDRAADAGDVASLATGFGGLDLAGREGGGEEVDALTERMETFGFGGHGMREATR